MSGHLDVSCMVGGPQGSGVESSSGIFVNACASMGYHVFGKREFYSNIKGHHSYFVIRVSDEQVRSNVNGTDILIAYDAETILQHYGDINRGGMLIYDKELDKTDIDDIYTLDANYAARARADLDSKNAPHSVQGAVDSARNAGVTVYPVSFRAILASLAESTDNPKLKNMTRMFNVIAAGLVMKALGVPLEQTTNAVARAFASKPKIAELGTKVLEHTYASADGFAAPATPLVPLDRSRPDTILAQGFYGTAIGKIAAGCRFQSYYPITPASDESVYLESHSIVGVRNDRPGSTLVVQCEDELSAIGMAIGSALTGTRSSTCTSGPGFSLMVECLGWAGMNEVPLVITLYQRSGPSTGLPTRHGQDDLLPTIHAGHGEFPRIVYASGDVEESFYDTGRCFNYAEKYQVPVIHMMDKFLASTVLTCTKFDGSKIAIERGKLLDKVDGKYKRFELGGDGISPRARMGLEDGVFWCTGDEHDEHGHITEDPLIRTQMMEKRQSREGLALRAIPDDEQAVLYGDGRIAVISWGSTKGPILDAIDDLAKRGIGGIRFVQVKMVHPFPTDYVRHLLEGAEVIVDVESNYTAQLGEIFSRNLCRDPDHYIIKYTGRAMTSTEIAGALARVADGSAKKREVLTYGA